MQEAVILAIKQRALRMHEDVQRLAEMRKVRSTACII
jgi:hypothetical protein